MGPRVRRGRSLIDHMKSMLGERWPAIGSKEMTTEIRHAGTIALQRHGFGSVSIISVGARQK